MLLILGFTANLSLTLIKSSMIVFKVTTDLLICMASLSLIDSFHGLDMEKLMRLAKLYPDDFRYDEILSLEQQFDIYIDNIRRDERFKNVENRGDLSSLIVKTQKHIAHSLDQFLSDCIVCFIEKELLKSVSNEKVIQKFPMMNES
ncbi:hypothetical protein N665_0334s0012 [Sinapis alba]|nr:hypothetical protein N665_0334s0012 [Sinapis alba]